MVLVSDDEVCRYLHLLTDPRAAIVKVGLADHELMQVVLTPHFIVLPSALTENADLK